MAAIAEHKVAADCVLGTVEGGLGTQTRGDMLEWSPGFFGFGVLIGRTARISSDTGRLAIEFKLSSGVGLARDSDWA